MLFEKVSKKEYAKDKLTFIEKAVLIGFIGIAKILIFKAGRAKTYGDLYKLGKTFEQKLDAFASKHENGNKTDVIVEDIEHFKKELTEV